MENIELKLDEHGNAIITTDIVNKLKNHEHLIIKYYKEHDAICLGLNTILFSREQEIKEEIDRWLQKLELVRSDIVHPRVIYQSPPTLVNVEDK